MTSPAAIDKRSPYSNLTPAEITVPSAFTALRKDFVRRGWYEKATVRIIVELVGHVGLALGGIALFVFSQHLALRLFGLLVSTYGSMGVGTNTHTSAHYATSAKRWLNEALTYFGFPVFLGVSATFWWHKHVAVHHLSPNVMGVDTDADLSPWFALSADEIEASSGWRRFYYVHLQFWVFPLAIAATCLNMQVASVAYLLQNLCKPQQRKAAHWIDAAVMLSHVAVWLVVPLLFFPLSYVVGFYFLRAILLGYAMYMVLAPGHLPAEAQRTTAKAGKELEFFVLQTEATISFRTGLIGRFLCSGLEYQVEHHLFPNISHVYYPQVSRAVQAFCLEHQLPYRSLNWGVALWKSWQVLRLPQPVIGSRV